MKTNYYLFLLSLLYLTGCEKSKLSFNPFDAVFDIDIAKLYRDTTLTIRGDCMAYGYHKDFGAYKTYYVVYILSEKKDSIAGKGMDILLGKRRIGHIDIDEDLPWMDSLVGAKQNEFMNYVRELPMDTIMVDSILNIYHLTRTSAFVKLHRGLEQKQYFIVCKDPEGKEYLFENQLDYRWLSKRELIGQRRLHFDTRNILDTAFYENYY